MGQGQLASFVTVHEVPEPEHTAIATPTFAVALARSRDGIVLVFNRYRNIWEVPGGFIDAGESPREAVARELEEEAGCTACNLSWLGLVEVYDGTTHFGAVFACEVDDVPPVFQNEEIAALGRWRRDHWPGPLGESDAALLNRFAAAGTMTGMHPITFAALEAFPRELEKHYAAFPAQFVNWAPSSWDGVPSEPFTAIEQICHVRDIEIEGYQLRFRRTLEEHAPFLPSIDSEAVAKARNYGSEDPTKVFAELRAARAQTLGLLRGLDDSRFARPAVFEGYGPVTLRGLVHYLCSHDQQHLSGLQWLLGKIDAASHAA